MCVSIIGFNSYRALIVNFKKYFSEWVKNPSDNINVFNELYDDCLQLNDLFNFLPSFLKKKLPSPACSRRQRDINYHAGK